jgi:hypothetical protein
MPVALEVRLHLPPLKQPHDDVRWPGSSLLSDMENRENRPEA